MIRKFEINKNGRDFCVGDIHGYFSKLELALKKVSFNPLVDRLFSVGDLVDRGPESDRVLEFLNQPWFFSVAGNHEFLTWRSALGNPYPHVDHEMHGGEWLNKLPKDLRHHIGVRLRDLPLAIEVLTVNGKVGIVHADIPFDDWSEMENASWTQNDSMKGCYDICLWSTERIERNYQNNVKGLRALIHGHVVVNQPKTLGNVHFIDTGAWLANKEFTLIDLSKL